jgi:RNA polymerase sigma-70 factor (ECF subfamily)
MTRAPAVELTGAPPRKALSKPSVAPDFAADDRELVRAARAGDRAAYGVLYERYAPMVHGILLSRVMPELADDLLQDVFLKAMTELRGLRQDDHFGGWIAAIARNRAMDSYRRNRETAAPEVLEAVSTKERSSAQAEARVVLAALQSLPDAYRETLTLRLIEGMTGPEIAARTGLTHDSVRVNLHRGMKQLRERMGLREAEEESHD